MNENLKKKFKENEKIKLFLIILLVSTVLCFNFIKLHTVPDTYNILVNKRSESITFFGDGRLITGIIVYLFGNINVMIPILMILSSIIGVICLTYSVYVLYNAVVDKNSTKITKLIILIGSYLTIFNPAAMEHFAYFESGIIILGKMLCVISAKKLILDGKILDSLLLVLLAGICYQGILNVFITIAILLILLQKDKGIKEKLKEVLWIGIISLITLVSIIITINIFNTSLGRANQQIATDFGKFFVGGVRRFGKIFFLLIKISIFATSNLFPKYFIIITVGISILLLKFLFNTKETLKYSLIILIVILVCVMPILLQKNLSIELRTITSVASIIGISIILLGKNLEENYKKYKEIIILIFSIILFSINSFYYIQNGIILSKSNSCEKQYMNEIVDIIKEYEEKENKKIKKVAFYYDSMPQKTFLNFKDSTFTIKGILTSYGRKSILEFYLKEPIQEIKQNENYTDYFDTKDWSSLSKEQFIFEDDTLHLCVY